MTNLEQYSSGLLDFHNHSTHSDGGDTPTGLVERAKRHNVSAIALTDHNVISGLEEFNHACLKSGIWAIPFGTEIHAELPDEILEKGDNDAPDVVILGRNPKTYAMNEYHAIIREDRRIRFLPETFEKLSEMGFSIPSMSIDEISRDVGVPEELHSFINEEKNIDVLFQYVRNFDSEISREEIQSNPIRFLNKYIYRIGGPAYSKRIQGFNTDNALRLAEDMNCKAIIAHPGGEFGFLSEKILSFFIEKGIPGIEIRNYFNTPEQNAKFDALAEKNRLIRSGGSDCHGDKGPFKIGMHDRPENQIPKEVLQELWDSLPA